MTQETALRPDILIPQDFLALSILEKHSIMISGHRTSITLERIFWQNLQSYAQHQNCSLQKVIETIDRHRQGSLSSAIRVWLMSQEGVLHDNY